MVAENQIVDGIRPLKFYKPKIKMQVYAEVIANLDWEMAPVEETK